MISNVVYLAAPRAIDMRSEELPGEPPANALLCKTLVTAISPGTEIGAYKGLPHLRADVTYPRLVGYCNVSEVLAVGSEVDEIRVGNRILSHTSHRSHAILPHADVLYVLGESDDSGAIACTYLFHLGYNAVLRAGVRAGSIVLVIGLGTLGLTSTAMAAQAGADVFAISDQSATAPIAREFGAIEVFTRTQTNALLAKLGPRLADVVITTTNGWSDWLLALQLAGQRGTIACIGFPGRGSTDIPFNPLDSQYFYVKQLRIEAVGHFSEARAAKGFPRFDRRSNLAYIARRIAGNQLRPELLVSGRYPADDIKYAYERLASRDGQTVTLLIDWA